MANPAWVAGGQSPNPGGRPSYAFTYQRFVDRSSYLMEKYDIDQILDLAKDNRKLAKACSYHDGMIVKRMARALEDDKTMERMLDRLLGRAIQRIGGENPGEGIVINQRKSIALDQLDPDALIALAEALRGIKQAQPLTIEPLTVESVTIDPGDKAE